MPSTHRTSSLTIGFTCSSFCQSDSLSSVLIFRVLGRDSPSSSCCVPSYCIDGNQVHSLESIGCQCDIKQKWWKHRWDDLHGCIQMCRQGAFTIGQGCLFQGYCQHVPVLRCRLIQGCSVLLYIITAAFASCSYFFPCSSLFLMCGIDTRHVYIPCGKMFLDVLIMVELRQVFNKKGYVSFRGLLTFNF